MTDAKYEITRNGKSYGTTSGNFDPTLTVSANFSDLTCDRISDKIREGDMILFKLPESDETFKAEVTRITADKIVVKSKEGDA